MLRRFKGMIYPGMANSYAGGRRVADRKSIWMVDYLRARQSGDKLRGFYRRKHFEHLTQ